MKKYLKVLLIALVILMCLSACEWVEDIISRLPYDIEGLPEGDNQDKYSQGLRFRLNEDKQSYSVVGTGSCNDLDIVIPSTYQGLPVTIIADDAFAHSRIRTSVTIPDSVTSIGKGAFWDCVSLTSVEIGDSVTSIGNSVFGNCTSLTSIVIPDSVTSIGSSAFYSCNSLVSVEIGDFVTSIGAGAFEGCTSLTSIEIPKSVTSIGDYAFSGCALITSIEIPDSVTSIGDMAFSYCDSLTSVEIGDFVTSIGAGAFSGCALITSIEIPDSVTSIGDNPFSECGSLQYNEYDNAYYLGNENNPYMVLICSDNSITNCEIHIDTRFIVDHAFFGCTSLTSIEIPKSVTSIGNYAFAFCDLLTSIEVDEDNEFYCSIDGNLYNKNVTTLIQYAIGKTDALFTIPDSVMGISDGAFICCDSLTSVVIPGCVRSVGAWTFEYCTSLTIYCEAESKPAGWNTNWNPDNRPVIWGYKGE